MKRQDSTDLRETTTRLLISLLAELPFDTGREGEKYLLYERFALTRETKRGAVGGWALMGVLICTRLIEASILFGPPVAGRLEMLQRWDRYTEEEMRELLEKQFGKKHPLKALAKSKEFKPLHSALRQPGLDFSPVGSAIISLLNDFMEPHKGLRKNSDGDWQSIRTGIGAAFDRVNARVDECFKPSMGKVRIRPAKLR
ncbi:hypothetical protein [Haloferula sp. BvORR071]|uniref:hypothetical protein n=1 Tax=Haloferula sp. BvORR071 TaxID=1396141 RepID=UPI000550A5B7|nr:hypothetical protein [Haloferula sp. BvORR071]